MAEPTKRGKRSAKAAGKPVDRQQPQKQILKLYVTGMTQNSVRAIENLRKICQDHLRDRYELEVIDIYQHPTLARGEQIVAAPTLVRKLPPPMRRFIGDLSSVDKILMGLDIKSTKTKK
jgi:circadian clock protein KaiB